MERREDLGIINFLLVMRNFSLNSHVFHTVDSFEFIRRNVKQKKGPFTATEQEIINIIKENPTLWQEAIAEMSLFAATVQSEPPRPASETMDLMIRSSKMTRSSTLTLL